MTARDVKHFLVQAKSCEAGRIDEIQAQRSRPDENVSPARSIFDALGTRAEKIPEKRRSAELAHAIRVFCLR